MAPRKKATEVAPVETPVVNREVTLDTILLDTDAKIKFMNMINLYKKQNPKKFESKEKEFIKKLLSM